MTGPLSTVTGVAVAAVLRRQGPGLAAASLATSSARHPLPWLTMRLAVWGGGPVGQALRCRPLASAPNRLRGRGVLACRPAAAPAWTGLPEGESDDASPHLCCSALHCVRPVD